MKSVRFSLIFAILASLACLLGLTWVLLSVISFKTAEQDLLAVKSEQGRVLLGAFVRLLPASPIDFSGVAAVRLAEGLSRERDFAGLAVFDREGRLLFQWGDGDKADAGILETLRRGKEGFVLSDDRRFIRRYAPIIAGDRIAGACRLSLSLDAEHARLQRSRNLFLAYFVLDSLLLVGFGVLLLSRVVLVPIRRLLAATERIAVGDYTHPVHVPGSVEIADLAEAFNSMLETLRSKDEAVATHVMSLEKANRELQSAREETLRSEKMASVGLLAAGMAHEIGTPLAAIMGYAELLQDELAQDPEKSDYVQRISADCARIDRLVRGLLDYARPAPSGSEPVDLAQLISATVELLSGQGVFKRIRVTLDLAEGLPPVNADRHQLQQVFINLLINARDALPGGGTLAVRGTVAPAGERRVTEWVRIEVMDSGCGILPAHQAQIFEPFFTTKEPGKGTGLGLAIVARIIDACGGKIGVNSTPGKGTTFTLLLPAAGSNRE
ncbi:MAG TPA: ATP-binding protein [Geobacteraceae bacterium]